MENLKLQIAKLLAKLNVVVKNLPTLEGIRLHESAKSLLGVDASPSDLAPDELGCAETVSNVINKAGFKMPIILSTRELFNYFSREDSWAEVINPLAGDVILSPTGFGGKNGITNGHTGIVGLNGVVMSNDSPTGKFLENYTLKSWEARYKIKGGYPIYFFRKTT